MTNTGLKFNARRKYVYQLRDAADVEADGIAKEKYIAVYFFDDEKVPRATISDGVGTNGQGIGGLFVEMDTLLRGDGSSMSSEGVLSAKNKEQHLCAADLYTASWRFGSGMTKAGDEEGGGQNVWWEVEYDVQGPKKGYVSRTRYTRD